MSIASQVTKNVYTANGSQTAWPYTFTIIDSTDIKVYVTDDDDVTTEVTSNFSVNTDTAEVTYPTAESLLDPVTSGYKVTLKRSVPRVQETDYSAQGAIPAQSIEDALDVLTILVQDLAEEVSRAIKYPVEQTPSETTVTGYLSTLSGYVASASTSAANAADSESDASGFALAAAASSSAAAGSALVAQQAAAATEAELAERISEGSLEARPVSLNGLGFYYATDIHQFFRYSPTNGWEAM